MEYEIDPHRSNARQVVMNCLYKLGIGQYSDHDINELISTANSVKLIDAEIQEVVRNIRRYKEN